MKGKERKSGIWTVVLILGAWSSSVLSQEAVNDANKTSVNLSLGLNVTMRKVPTPIAGIELNLSKNYDLYGVHFFHTHELNGFGGGDAPTGIDEGISGIGVTYGRSHSFKLGRPLFPFFSDRALGKARDSISRLCFDRSEP